MSETPNENTAGEQPDEATAERAEHADHIDDGIGTYDVVLLVEHEVSPADAAQIHSLHDSIGDQVVYHVLIPLEDASARIEASLGALGAGDVMASPALAINDIDIEAVRQESQERADSELDTSLAALAATGAKVRGVIVTEPPVDALASTVTKVEAREAIILTRPHVVAEFFHVDWASRARRKIGVPVLHLLEHESFEEQSGGGEGISGF